VSRGQCRGPRVPLVRAPGRVQRVGEQDERKRRPPRLARIGGGQARDAPAEGMPADGEPQPGRDVWPVGREPQRVSREAARQQRREPRDGALRAALWEVDCASVDPPGPEAGDVRRHAGRRPGRPVAEHEDRGVRDRFHGRHDSAPPGPRDPGDRALRRPRDAARPAGRQIASSSASTNWLL
jgi:hypothetical protein